MNINYISASVEKILGYNPEELIGKNFGVFMHPNDISSVKNDFEEILKLPPNVSYTFSSRIKYNAGAWIYVNALANNLFGNPIIKGVVITVRDITSQHMADEEMRKLNSVIEQTADIVLITDKDGFIEYVNPAFESVTGYSKKEILGENPRILKSDKQDKLFYEEFWSGILAGKVFHGEVINKKKNGQLYYEEKTVTPVKDNSGNITNFVSIGLDISEHKNIENQLQQAQKMEAIGTLAGGVAHDFNNILTTIQGYTELIMSDIDKESSTYKDLEHVKNASERAAKLTQQLLVFSRRKQREITVLNINNVIESLFKMLKRMLGEDIRVEMDLSPKIKQIKGDESNIEQIIMNIVVNARDSMPSGGALNIKTENVYIDEEYSKSITGARPGEFISISIADTGEGMSKEILQHIFEPFFTTKEKDKGTGLGLAVVYGIVKQHEGWINVYSEIGFGSIFRIYLPVAKGKLQTIKKDIKFISDVKGNNERILVVEDDKGIGRLTEEILKRNNYNVFMAHDAKSALEVFEQGKGNFDLVFSDMILPDISGVELVEKMLKINPKLKIVFASGYANHRTQLDVIQEKGYCFLQKPYKIEEMLIAVKETINK
jgi:PAS domain S-box-containing protein